MTELTRRFFLGGSAATAAGLVAARADDVTEDPQFPHQTQSGILNKTDPLLDGDELPTFRFALEKTEGKVIGGSSGKEATVEQLPISKGIAGVSMRLEVGAYRELHWHATAAEWAFVIEGTCRTTVVDPDGRAETNDFGPGDVWYFPRGHGHSIQNTGDTTVHFILIFDNGYFSEFGTFSVTDWIGLTPKDTLAKNFGLPDSALEKFPKKEVYFVRTRKPPAEAQKEHRGDLASPPETHKYRMLAQEPHSIHTGGREWRIDASKFPISKTVTGVVLDLEPGGLRELHWHPNADEWQYVISGRIRVDLFGAKGRWRRETLEKGDVGYVPAGYGHSIENDSDTEPTRVLIGFNTGHYQAIDLSLWLAANPDYLLKDHFGIDDEVVRKLPKGRVFIASKDGPEK